MENPISLGNVPKVGDRVIMTADHPWRGEVGTYVKDEEIPDFGPRPKVKLDNGTSCFVMQLIQFRKLR
jgi:hypothetical protein